MIDINCPKCGSSIIKVGLKANAKLKIVRFLCDIVNQSVKMK